MTPGNSTIHSGKESIFSFFFIFLGFFWNDVINYSMPTPIGSSVMLVDVFFFLSLFYAIKEVNFFKFQTRVILLCALMVLYIGIGFLGFGMSAVSDCRQFYHFFFLFLGFAYLRNTTDQDFLFRIFKVIFSIALGSFLLFVVEVAIGHRFGLAIAISEEAEFGLLQDERGVRILGAVESFNLCLLVLFYYFFRNRIRMKGLLTMVVIFLIAALITQNRTPIIAALFGYVATQVIFLRVRKGRVHWIFIQLGFTLMVGLFIYLLDYYGIFPLFSTLKSAVSVQNDEIGTTGFRVLGALGALQIFFANIFLGEGLGRGWQIDFGFSVLNIPPHNQYAALLAKFGLIGFTAFLIWMNGAYKVIKRFYEKDHMLFRFSMVLFLSQIAYGFGYDFHPFMPFYIGMLLTRGLKPNIQL